MFSAFFLTGYLLIGGCQRSPEVSEPIARSIQLDTVVGALEPRKIASDTSDRNSNPLLQIGDSLEIDQDPRLAPERITRTPVPWIRADSAAGLLEAGGVLLHVGIFEDYLAWSRPEDDYYTPKRLEEVEAIYDLRQRIVLIADNTNDITHAANLFSSKGYSNVFAVEQGYAGWRKHHLGLPVGERLVAAGDTFSISTGAHGHGGEIYKKTGDKRLLAYLFPLLTQQLWWPLHIKHTFVYSLKPTQVVGDRLWFGFYFYSGESDDGVGGLGFYDPVLEKSGILRHPALTHCATLNFAIEPERIVIQTIDYGGVCAGIVVIDRKTWHAYGLAPAGNGLLWQRDEPDAGVEHLYYAALRTLLSDPQFVRHEVRQWDDSTITRIKDVGLDSFMVARAEVEAMRHLVPEPAGLLVEDRLIYVANWRPSALQEKLLDGVSDPDTAEKGSYWLVGTPDTTSTEGCKAVALRGVRVEWQPAGAPDLQADTVQIEINKMLRFSLLDVKDYPEDPYQQSKFISDPLEIVWMAKTSDSRTVLFPEDIVVSDRRCVDLGVTVRRVERATFRLQRYDLTHSSGR